ncbi:MAG TPA: toll/interleukin-1 receptor domain-containing protein [Thermoanaerobaculia bacterium]
MQKHVFISYSSKDAASAKGICESLERQGIACWIAPRDVAPGHDYDEEIIDAIDATSALLLILSEHSNESVHVKHEVERAVRTGKPIFPVRIQDVQPSKKLALHISTRHWLDAWEPPLEPKLVQLAAGVRRLAKIPEDPRQVTAEQLPPASAEAPAPILPTAVPESAAVPPTTEPMATESRSVEASTSPLPHDPSAREAVERALGEIQIKTGAHMGGLWLKDENSSVVWMKLYREWRQRAVSELCSLLTEPGQDSERQLKAILLLKQAVFTPEGRRSILLILDSVHEFVSEADQRGKAALELISAAPVPPKVKWERVFPLLETAPKGARQMILMALPSMTPPEEKARTGEAILDLFTFAPTADGSYEVSAIRALDYRAGIPMIRDLVTSSPLGKAELLAELLARWRDKDSVSSIREAIENWRYTAPDLGRLIESLQELDGPACASYLAKILLDGTPALQWNMLEYHRLKDYRDDPSVLEAVRKVEATASDPRIKKLAQDFLSQGKNPGV